MLEKISRGENILKSRLPSVSLPRTGSGSAVALQREEAAVRPSVRGVEGREESNKNARENLSISRGKWYSRVTQAIVPQRNVHTSDPWELH